MASIAQMPRSATAVAKTPCRVIGLDNGQFQNALRMKPEFALILMSVMIGRIRGALGRAGTAAGGKVKESAVFDKSSLAILERALAQTMVRYERNKTIVTEGQPGVMMYVVVDGKVAVSIQGKLVEKIGPGGVFGEMALVDRAPRLATVVSETNCGLLAIGRNTFLDLIKASPDFAALSSDTAKTGLALIRSRKVLRPIASSPQLVSETTVARRGARSTSAISPNTPPGPIFSTSLPWMETATLPSTTTYIITPGWPSVTMVLLRS